MVAVLLLLLNRWRHCIPRDEITVLQGAEKY